MTCCACSCNSSGVMYPAGCIAIVDRVVCCLHSQLPSPPHPHPPHPPHTHTRTLCILQVVQLTLPSRLRLNRNFSAMGSGHLSVIQTTQHPHSPSLRPQSKVLTQGVRMHTRWVLGLEELVSTAVITLVPRPFELMRRKGLVHIVRTCAGGPQKKIGGSDIIVYSSGFSGKADTCMCTRPFLFSPIQRA